MNAPQLPLTTFDVIICAEKAEIKFERVIIAEFAKEQPAISSSKGTLY